MINTNDAIKGKSDEYSKIEQIGMDQISNVEDEEIDGDNIPLNKISSIAILQKQSIE